MVNDNVPASQQPGAPKHGDALLAGLVRCRRCGRKLTVRYTGTKHNIPRYSCHRGYLDKGEPSCIAFGGLRVDDAIEIALLQVVEPGAVVAAVVAETEANQRRDQVREALLRDLEAVRFAADRAFRRYDATDPTNRLVAGVKAAQERIRMREGGVIWHTQGSGKSILMVLVAKWLLEHDPEARVLIITDRDELDKQIEGVMKNAGVVGADSPSPRITSRAQFVESLSATTPRLLCALVHKFELDLKSPPPPIHGRFYVFVDECHRTQGGNMNKQMKRWLENAIFIGFTGTPLLRKDKQTTRDVFGTYIHTYKFQEAVADKVILDLKYDARDVPQRLTSQKAIDAWFDQKTKGLNNFQRAVLRKRWATMEELMSAGERKQRIIADAIHDFGVQPRLNNDRGTAILVAASIYDACHYFRLFQNTSFGKYCGIITSYEPNHNAISREPATRAC
jgi:type I site-specific restriction-modification system R (restriction) subunit